MNVKQAVATAKGWLAETLEDEQPSNLGLEEIEYDERGKAWKVTLGFSRPWNSVRNALTAVTGEPAPRRAYRVITIDDKTGRIRSMRRTGSEE